jgi:cytochrome c-type biogenesis protein CcmE
MTRKQRRLTLIGTGLATIATALGLVSFAMRDTIVFFHTPSEVQARGVAPGTRFRLGGLVQEDSLRRADNQVFAFRIEDANGDVSVQYRGLLPDLFREGQGVVAEGVLDPGGVFKADTVLAKHDENYMPREVADALKSQDHWQGEGPAATGAPKRASPRALHPRTSKETAAHASPSSP